MKHLADGAVLLDLPNQSALDLAAALAARPPEGFLDAVPGARTLLLLFDPERLHHDKLDEVLQRVGKVARPASPRTVRFPVCYDGPDLEALARDSSIPAEELVRRHAAAEHTVAFLGFTPGFAYLSGAPRELSVPRLSTPRLRVPAGSVAVADGYTGIYPLDTPGGWRLIGRIAAQLFDPAATPPSVLQPGDRVVFEPVADLPDPYEAPPRPPARAGPPLLRVVSPGSFTTVQGGPRFGLCASGVPAGGAMDLASLSVANALVGNPAFAAGLEITVAGPVLEALETVRLALAGGELDASVAGRKLDGRGPFELRAGEQLRLGAIRRGVRTILAVEGGLAEPLPGEPTRALSRGEELLRALEAPTFSARPPPQPAFFGERFIELRALAGPQPEYFSQRGREIFFSAEFRLSPASDRRGLRLDGPTIELLRAADLPPEGTAPGAVQVPGNGLPIVLGPERPVTGGYPKIATVISADLPLLAQARPGTGIRFRPVGLAEALAARRGE